MTTGVGLTVGDSVSTAVVTASGTDVRTIEHPSVLFTAPDGTVQLGDPGTESTGAVRDFLARVGEPAGIEYAGSLTRAEDLVATAMFCLFREASDGLTGTVKVTATHPSGWAPEIVTKLRESLDYMGLGEATLIAESVALTASAESPAHGAALLAAGLALTDEDTSADTESIPVVEAPLHTAYSAVTAVPAVAAASDAFPPAATEASAPASAPTPPVTRTNRRPLIIAGVAAAALVLAGGTLAFALTGHGSTEVPSIQDAQTAPVTTSSARPTTVGSVVFPTASTQEVALTTEERIPVPVAPPPAPVETTTPFVPPPPPPPTSTPVITLPSITTVPQTTTTTTAATTTTTTTTPPETTTSTETETESAAAIIKTTTTPPPPQQRSALITPGE
ncbi:MULTISPECIES: hypothetical protein [unclassified Rhodococcus (in: high G+C Gram-positive bacteria)]|uniref:hypothetical protein n=1 Tax=unclassified Rhodococcus (in: high G+C Gram-positive bacteria) TaxID=192944 RepID=UPI0016395F45|nr:MULTISPECIES: hypothetical protein [unclassified Rhodococcus (in: high G+C Gram-positive bacteria)]MBC2642756.1 hypothetical protein [Rhodococcus sp. 3A]MBC2892502.1 hypothetical protein [Rhodococcus sp. 4CII]